MKRAIKRYWSLIVVTAIAAAAGCSGPVVIDRSSDAFAAGDLSLLHACQASPGRGVDSCQFTVGDTVSSHWTLIAPKPKNAVGVDGGEADIYFHDIHKSYPIKDWTIDIPWADFLGITKWTADFDETVAEALLTLEWTDNQGIKQITKFRGIAVLIVTAQGFDRMPIDSGQAAWGTTCKVQYSTAGRSAVSCK